MIKIAQIIGLTGGIASGKSTVAKVIKDLGIIVIDADQVAREVVQVGESAYYQIIKTFGKGILNDDQTINRDKLGAIIFNDKDKRKKLNDIVHPAIRKRMNEQKEKYISEGKKTIVLDIPLLFESNRTDQVDKILLVYVNEDVQLQRLMERNHLNKEEAMARIKSQIPLSKKKQMADEVIDNNGTIEETKKQLYDILIKWDII